MPHQEKNTKGLHINPTILLPITGSIFAKKAPMKKPEPSSLDFHLEMIKKIDKLLADHEPEEITNAPSQQPPLIPHQPPSPIEPRSPIAKTFVHDEITWKPPVGPARTHTTSLPEEFKTELSVTPEFRFITSLEFLQTVSDTPQASSEERVEIIDINALTGETTSHHITSFLNIKNQDEKIQVSPLNKETIEKGECHNKKVEVIDTQALDKQTSEETWVTAAKQATQIEKKAKVYFLNKKDEAGKKQKNKETEESYIPDDIEERLKALKDKKKKEEEQRRLLGEQSEEEFQEEEILDGEENNEEKSRKGLLARQEKIGKDEQKKTDDDEQSTSGKDPSLYKTASELKKELKEQKRLHQLAIRQARIEERQRKKAEKEAQKSQKKHTLPEKEQKPPVELKPPEQDSTNEKEVEAEDEAEDAEAEQEEDERDQADDLDEDIRKVLLMTDYLLGELPEDVLNIFLESEEFKLYEKVLSKYKIKIK